MNQHLSTLTRIRWHCPRCGTTNYVEYENGDAREWAVCQNRCDLPSSITHAIADWLDARIADGNGEPVRPTKADLCGYRDD